MKSFLEMWKVLEVAELGTNKPVPLSKITPQLAQTAVNSGKKDNENNKQNNKDQVGANPEDTVTVGSLNPMQKEVIPSKAIAFALGFLKDGKPDLNDMEAIVSNDGYIMDGHHRWAAMTLINPSAQVKVAKVALPAAQLVTALNLWTKAKGRSGNAGKGDVSQFASSVPSVIDQFIQNGTDQWPNLNAEEVKISLGKIPGANGDAEQGKKIMISNAQKLPAQKHPEAPERVDMPVVKNKQEIDDVIKKLMAGDIDWNIPLSKDTQVAMGVTLHNVGADATQQTQSPNQATVAPNAQQQNVGANQQVPGTGQINVGANLAAPQTNAAPQIKKFPQQQPQQKQVASTHHEGPSLNEWLILAGVKENEF